MRKRNMQGNDSWVSSRIQSSKIMSLVMHQSGGGGGKKDFFPLGEGCRWYARWSKWTIDKF